MKQLTTAILAGCLWIGAAFLGPAQAFAKPKVYSVIFEIGPDAKIVSMAVSSVIDPCSGKTDAVVVRVPDEYVRAARAAADAQTDLPPDKTFYTYRFFDPRYPGAIDLMPRC